MITHLKELYKFRALIWALTIRHLSVRYRGSVLGFLWSLLNPLCLMLVYTLVFKFYIRFDNVEHYTIVLLCGLLPWIWLSSAFNEGTSAIVSSGHLITKSMFPAHVLPTVSVIATGINFLLSLPILFVFMLIGGLEFHWTLFLLPVLIALQFMLLLGAVIALGAVNVQFRDVQHVVANGLTFLFFLCPIVYPAKSVPEKFSFLLKYNPFALLTMAYTQVVVDGIVPPLAAFGVIFSSVLICLFLGYKVFESYRESFAELL